MTKQVPFHLGTMFRACLPCPGQGSTPYTSTSSPTLRDVVSVVSEENQKAQLVCLRFSSLI